MSSRPSQIASYTKLMYSVRFDIDHVIKSKYYLLNFVLFFYSYFGCQDASFPSLFYLNNNNNNNLLFNHDIKYSTAEVVVNVLIKDKK